MKCRAIWLGSRDYREAWELQRALAGRRLVKEIEDTLLLLEHPPTVTFGRGAAAEHLVASPETLARRGVTVVECDRGGDVTYHGPGQLVGYPILDLQSAPHTPDLHGYLRKLEECLIQALSDVGVAAGRIPRYTGVWTRLDTPAPEKIAAIGIKAGRWITQHGFALNVNTDVTSFDLIVPCGIHQYGVTSVGRLLNRPVSVEELIPVVTNRFAEVFQLECLYEDQSAALLTDLSHAKM